MTKKIWLLSLLIFATITRTEPNQTETPSQPLAAINEPATEDTSNWRNKIKINATTIIPAVIIGTVTGGAVSYASNKLLYFMTHNKYQCNLLDFYLWDFCEYIGIKKLEDLRLWTSRGVTLCQFTFKISCKYFIEQPLHSKIIERITKYFDAHEIKYNEKTIKKITHIYAWISYIINSDSMYGYPDFLLTLYRTLKDPKIYWRLFCMTHT